MQTSNTWQEIDMAKFCRNCGSALNEGAAFCMKCGTPTGNVKSTANGQPGNRNTGTGPMVMRPGYTGAAAAPARVKRQRPFSERLKESVGSYFKHPVKLLPAIVLAAIWIAFSLMGTLGSSSPLIRILSMITYSNGGMYGGIMGSIGGIFGKAFFSAIITSMINSLADKKNSAKKRGRVKAGMQGATLRGLKAVTPFMIGSGAGLALYWLFNITSTPKNIMVAVAGAVAAVVAVMRGHGLLFSLVSGISGSLSKNRIPSLSAVKRALSGFAAGFAVAVPVTFMRKPGMIISIGAVLLILGILLSIIGKNGAKRMAAAAAIMLMVGSPLLPFVRTARAAEIDPSLVGDYTGTIQMVSGAVTDEGYAAYTDGNGPFVSFVNNYMGGTSETLSRDDFDAKLGALIQNAGIKAVGSVMIVEPEDPSAGKYKISFLLEADDFAWKSEEDVYKLGSDSIVVVLNGTYEDGGIRISGGSGDVTGASGKIEFVKEGEKVLAHSSDLQIVVAGYYTGLVQIDAQLAEPPASGGGKPGLSIDDIVGYYLYTGMNYATEKIEDFYYKIEKISSSSYRFTSLTPPSEEIPEIDWSQVYGEDENVEVILTENHVDLTIYRYNSETATGKTDESINGTRVIEHYPSLGVSTETYNAENKSYCDMVFSIGEDNKIHAVYENHFDFGAGYGTMDHWDLIKVDHLPGEELESVPEEVPPEPEIEEEEPESIEPEPDEPEDVAPPEPIAPPETDGDPDHDDLPDSEQGIIIDSVSTALIGGGLGTLLGGIAGAMDGGDDDGGGGEDGGPDLPPSWRVSEEGDISFEDPSTGQTVTYERTGIDPDTGQPVYHNSESWGQGYDINDLKDMYDRTSRERDYYRNIEDTYRKGQEEQRKENQDLSWEAKDWEREKKEIAERERLEDKRNEIAYKHGVYDGNTKEVKKAILKERGEEYQKQAQHETRAEYMNAGYQTAQTVQKGADVAIDVTEKIASYTPAAPAAKLIKKTYIASKNVASNVGELTAGTKNWKQATADAVIGTAADLTKDSADGFGQKLLYNTTMEGGKTVYQGWVDGKSAEKIRDETIKKMEKAFDDTINEAVITGVTGDTPLGTLMTDLANMEENED